MLLKGRLVLMLVFDKWSLTNSCGRLSLTESLIGGMGFGLRVIVDDGR